MCDGESWEATALPKPEGGCCAPELVGLGRVILDKLLVIDHEQGVSWDILWEWGQRHGGWYVRFCFGNTGLSPCFSMGLVAPPVTRDDLKLGHSEHLSTYCKNASELQHLIRQKGDWCFLLTGSTPE